MHTCLSHLMNATDSWWSDLHSLIRVTVPIVTIQRITHQQKADWSCLFSLKIDAPPPSAAAAQTTGLTGQWPRHRITSSPLSMINNHLIFTRPHPHSVKADNNQKNLLWDFLSKRSKDLGGLSLARSLRQADTSSHPVVRTPFSEAAPNAWIITEGCIAPIVDEKFCLPAE